MRFLIIDDSPGRYEEFTRLLDESRIKWIISCDPEFVEFLSDAAAWGFTYDAILLDHDMPHRDGREWAKWLVENDHYDCPVVITSTTSLPNAREEMLKTLQSGGIPSLLCPADHMHCEIEWLNWIKGCVAGMENNCNQTTGDDDELDH